MVRQSTCLLAVFYLAVSTSPGIADTFPADAYANYQGDANNGRYLFNASGCGACHGSADDLRILSGGQKMESSIGAFYAPNISSSPQGIGSWSNADFLNAVMRGVRPGGELLYPVMPFPAYGGMNPTDVLDIKTYIATLPPSDATNEAPQVGFPYNIQFFRSRFQGLARPFTPGDGSQLDRGRYLVENVGACGECHTPRTLTYQLDQSRKFAGEKGLAGAFAPDISAARLASVDPAVFIHGVLVQGKKLSGTPLSAGLMGRISKGTAELSEADRLAMLAYLRGQPVQTGELLARSACVAPDVALVTGTDAEADKVIGTYCRSCHGSGRSNENVFPAGSLASMALDRRFVTPGKPEQSSLYTSITSGRMPKGLGSQPNPEELRILKEWIEGLRESGGAKTEQAGTTERGRPVLRESDNIFAALKDIETHEPRDRTYMRYLTFRPQYNGHVPCETPQQFAERQRYMIAGTIKLVNSLSSAPSLVTLETVPGSDATLHKIDLRDLGWSAEDWEKLRSTYIYATDPLSSQPLSTLSRQTRSAIPIVRADWFAAHASKPPLYHDFLKLPAHIDTYESDVLNVDVLENIRNARVMRSALLKGSSGVSDFNRMIERHELPNGRYYWKSYDFGGDSPTVTKAQSLLQFPHGPQEATPLPLGLKPFHHDGGEMIFSLPNGLQGYYLTDSKGERLNEAPQSIVSFRDRPIGRGVTVINGRSCFDCHSEGIIGRTDQLRGHLESSSHFTLEQRGFLLRLYPRQEALDAQFSQDIALYLKALNEIGAAETGADGRISSLKMPIGGRQVETITFFADLYEDALNIDELSAEFDLSAKEFSDAVRHLKGQALDVGLDWLGRASNSAIPRVEVELNYEQVLAGLGERRTLPATTKPDVIQPDSRIDVAPKSVNPGEQISLTADISDQCAPAFFDISSSGTVQIIPDNIFVSSIQTVGLRRFAVSRATPFGLQVLDSDERGDHSIGYLCQPNAFEEVKNDLLRSILKRLRDGEAKGEVISTRGEKVFFEFDSYIVQ